ncbi:hypothetical protein BJX61DRAFT_133562 [Aspergillus egyptiacus]|nr:hypothetical protein BJX61DRAFT_133562 [Aspergillus egyptiacus]
MREYNIIQKLRRVFQLSALIPWGMMQLATAQVSTESPSSTTATEIPSTTTIPLFAYLTRPRDMEHFSSDPAAFYTDVAASVVSVDWTKNMTTLLVQCRHSRTATCLYPGAVTWYTIEPSALEYTFLNTINNTGPDARGDPGYSRIDMMRYCHVLTSAGGAVCSSTYSFWASYNSTVSGTG